MPFIDDEITVSENRDVARYVRNLRRRSRRESLVVVQDSTKSWAPSDWSISGGKMTEVGYKGSAQTTQALLAGEVKVTIDPIVSVMPYVQSGKVRVVAMTGARRSPAFPDIPTVAESGVPGYAFENWHAILLPANAPREIVQRLHAELAKAARHPDVIAKVAPLGVEIVASTPEELQARATTEREHWSKQIRSLGIKAE